MDEKLIAEFHEQMVEIYRRAKDEAGYTAARFIGMVADDKSGGVDTAKRLIHSTLPSDGYTALYLLNHLDLTVEAVIADNPKWHPLFSVDDLAACHKRLHEYQYKSY